MRSPYLALSLALIAGAAPSQEPKAEGAPSQEPKAEGASGRLAWPRDEQRAIARVDGRDLTLGDLVRHVKARHEPFFDHFLSTPGGARCFTDERFGADWVREFADATALREEAHARSLDLAPADAVLGAALKQGFETWLAGQSLPPEPSQELIDHFLATYQRMHGLEAEVRGWLDFLVPDTASDDELGEFFHGHPRFFGGAVTLAHILVRHRHPATLELLDDAGRAAAWDKIADLRARLRPDGSNFEELAERFSDDRRTAARGGVLEQVERFSPLLPAVLCRTAWNLEDGAVSDAVESPYGLHLVKRIELDQRSFILFTDAAVPTVRQVRRQYLQEDLLFAVRAARRVALLY